MNDPVTHKSIYPTHGNNAAVVIDRSAYHSILYYALRLDGLALRLSSPSHKFSLTAPHIMLSSVRGIAVQEPGFGASRILFAPLLHKMDPSQRRKTPVTHSELGQPRLLFLSVYYGAPSTLLPLAHSKGIPTLIIAEEALM